MFGGDIQNLGGGGGISPLKSPEKNMEYAHHALFTVTAAHPSVCNVESTKARYIQTSSKVLEEATIMTIIYTHLRARCGFWFMPYEIIC